MTNSIERLTANRVAVMNGLRQAGYRTLANQVGVDLAALADEYAGLRAIIVNAARVPDFAPRCGDDADAVDAFYEKAAELEQSNG